MKTSSKTIILAMMFLLLIGNALAFIGTNEQVGNYEISSVGFFDRLFTPQDVTPQGAFVVGQKASVRVYGTPICAEGEKLIVRVIASIEGQTIINTIYNDPTKISCKKQFSQLFSFTPAKEGTYRISWAVYSYNQGGSQVSFKLSNGMLVYSESPLFTVKTTAEEGCQEPSKWEKENDVITEGKISGRLEGRYIYDPQESGNIKLECKPTAMKRTICNEGYVLGGTYLKPICKKIVKEISIPEIVVETPEEKSPSSEETGKMDGSYLISDGQCFFQEGIEEGFEDEASCNQAINQVEHTPQKDGDITCTSDSDCKDSKCVKTENIMQCVGEPESNVTAIGIIVGVFIMAVLVLIALILRKR